MIGVSGALLVIALAGGVGASAEPLLASAISGGGGSRDISSASPTDDASALLAALAPAPQSVVLETRSFGTVTVTHSAHLARRHACRACHGPGPVAKIGHFEPKVAHERCIGCHKHEKRGPTGCRDCHAVPVKIEPAATTQQVADAAPSANAPSGAIASLAPAQAGPELERARAEAMDDRPQRSSFLRIAGFGYSVLGGPGQRLTTGPAVYFSMREDDVILLYALERGSSAAGSRTLGLLGAGLKRQLFGSGWNAFGAVLGGFNAGEAPVSMVPNAGLRVGAEWIGRRTALTLGVTGSSDLVRQENKLGERIGGFTFAFSASVGYVLSRD